MIDLMENPVEGKGSLTYLIMIDPLTRKLWAEPTNPAVPGGAYRFDNQKNQEQVKVALEKIFNGSGLSNFHLIGDSEAAFMAPEVRSWLRGKGADFTAVARQKSVYPDWMAQANSRVKEEPEHRKLGTIDRVIRTLRDMAFAQHWELITPPRMKYLVSEYNS
jgi:hypothetical protein